jgi:transcriptional regulator with XRE-family HTH domain
MAKEPQPDPLESVAANLVRNRRRLGLTQADLAERAEMEVRQVQRAESGKIDVGIVTLVVLAKALEVAPGLLLRPARLVRAGPGRPRMKRIRESSPR